jgi:hypothetical protein
MTEAFRRKSLPSKRTAIYRCAFQITHISFHPHLDAVISRLTLSCLPNGSQKGQKTGEVKPQQCDEMR